MKTEDGEVCALTFDSLDYETVTVSTADITGRRAIWLFFEGDFVLREIGFP